MQCCCIRWTAATGWCEKYESMQSFAVLLLYIQVVCALVGSLGAAYTGIVLANLALALFALVAIECGSQTLGRVYAGLLAFALLLDIVWFILFTSEIRYFAAGTQYGKFGAFSLKLMFWMQATGCALRVVSSSVWIQIYRLGSASDTAAIYHPIEFDDRLGNLSSLNPGSPCPAVNVRSTSLSDEVLGGSIYNPAAYSSSLLRSFNDDSALTLSLIPKESSSSSV